VSISGHEALLLRAAERATLLGTPFESLADYVHRIAAEEADAKVVSFADMRDKLRPPATAAVTETTPH
jgi:hypothetical protein